MLRESNIIVGGFGIGTFFFNILCTKTVNPDNLKQDDNGHFPDSVNDKVKEMLLLVVMTRAILAVIAACLVFEGPDPTSSKQVD